MELMFVKAVAFLTTCCLLALLSTRFVPEAVKKLFRAKKVTPYGILIEFHEAILFHFFYLIKGLFCLGNRQTLLKQAEDSFWSVLNHSGPESSPDDGNVMITHSCRTIFYCVIQAIMEGSTKRTPDGTKIVRICTASLHFGSFYRLLQSIQKDDSVKFEFYQVDLSEDDWTLDEDSIDEEEVRKCDLIMCQHFFGVPFQQERFFQLGRKYNIPILEDCVQSGSLFGHYKGHPLADVSIWSGGLDKTPSTMGGGFGFFSSSPNGKMLFEHCQSRHQPFPVDTLWDRFVSLCSQLLHLMIAKNTFWFPNILGVLLILILKDGLQKAVHDLALVVRKDKKVSPFQHATSKFCRQPSVYQLLSVNYGLSLHQRSKAGACLERRGMELLLSTIPAKYHKSLFPMWTEKALQLHKMNQGIPVYTWVVSEAGKRAELATFLADHGLIPLINTTWEIHDDGSKRLAKDIVQKLLYLPNLLQLKEREVMYIGKVLTKWCHQDELAAINAKPTGTDQPMLLTMEEVALHNTSKDFWTVVNGVVYDMSSYEHPGGSIIMNAAGNDSTVLFHQYHLNNPSYAKKILSGFEIGRLQDKAHRSPVMGKFYEAVSERVRRHLTGRARRPQAAKISWVVDACLMAFLLGISCFVRTNWPLWILIILHLVAPNISSLRMEGQQHANGHLQIWGSSQASMCAEIFGYLLGVPAMFGYGLPEEEKNTRELLHKPRSQAQYELPEGRGFAEHTAIHHVKGASLEHDQCFKLVSVMGILRFSQEQPVLFPLTQKYQHQFWFQALLDIIVEAADCTKLPFFVPRIQYVFNHLLPAGDYVRGVAILVGTVSSTVASWSYLALPFSGWTGFQIFVLLGVLKEVLGLYGVQVFFAQHVWDHPVEEETADTDWGRHNAESCYSWWASPRDTSLYPILWASNGACPSTLTYHLEHTLFPGLNYMYLPEIAPIVQSTCKEFGITYNQLPSSEMLLKVRQEKLRLYSTSTEKALLGKAI